MNSFGGLRVSGECQELDSVFLLYFSSILDGFWGVFLAVFLGLFSFLFFLLLLFFGRLPTRVNHF